MHQVEQREWLQSVLPRAFICDVRWRRAQWIRIFHPTGSLWPSKDTIPRHTLIPSHPPLIEIEPLTGTSICLHSACRDKNFNRMPPFFVLVSSMNSPFAAFANSLKRTLYQAVVLFWCFTRHRPDPSPAWSNLCLAAELAELCSTATSASGPGALHLDRPAGKSPERHRSNQLSGS